MSADPMSIQLSAAIRHLYEERNISLQAAVVEGHRLLGIATLLGDVPEELLVPNQVASIVSALSIEDPDEQVDVSDRVTSMFEDLLGGDAHAV